MSAPAPRKESVKQRYGDYVIGRTFAKGSFGKLKLGTHIPTGTKLAIKVLSRQKITSKMDVKIRREIRILRLFRHPSICRLYDVIYTPTEIFLVMEYVGPELYEYIVKNGKLKEDAARYMFQQLICALEYCHHFRVVHRDLKPENVLLGGGSLSVKLIDFGLSNLMQDATFLKTSCGSPNYAAPEVISGRLYAGPEIDVWSCGVVLYALLCGCLPFDEESVPTLFAKIKRGRYNIPPHISPLAKDLIEKLLVVDPLTRITIPQIRDHPWFLERLPEHLHYSVSTFNKDRQGFHPDLVQKAMNMLGMTPEEVNADLEAREGRAWVTCSILADQQEAIEIATVERREFQAQSGTPPPAPGGGAAEGGVAGGAPSTSPSSVVKAYDRETNQGLVLSACPAMTVLLEMNDAVSNKYAYNTGNYMPASVQESKSTLTVLTAAGSPGHFSLKSASSNHNNGGGSMPITSSLRAGSLNQAAAQMGSHTAARLRSGSVAKVDKVYTAEEETFVLQNNTGWRIGLMLGHGSAQCMGEIYLLLTSLNMEWKVLNQFQLAVRRKSSSSSQQQAAVNPVVITIHLMRIQEKHDKGYLVDLGLCRGASVQGLDMIHEVGQHIKARLG